MFLRRNDLIDWNKLDDQELWGYLPKGYEDALSELFIRYYRPLFRYGLGLTDEEDTVKDEIQELFLNLWKHHATLGEADSVKVYLFVSLRRLILRRHDHSKSRKKREQSYYSEELEEHAPPIDQILISREINSELSKNLQVCLQTLPRRQREALFLRLNQGLTNSEIAHVMKITNQRVRSLISESIQRLKSELTHNSL